jgi:hypothetical protein
MLDYIVLLFVVEWQPYDAQKAATRDNIHQSDVTAQLLELRLAHFRQERRRRHASNLYNLDRVSVAIVTLCFQQC